MKTLPVLGMALLFLIPLARTVFAAPAINPAINEVPAEAIRLPFKGSMQSKETSSTVSPTRYVTGNGSGDATQLGPFLVSYHIEQNLLDLSGTQSAHFAGTNGDSLQTKGVGQAIEDRTPGMYNVIEIYTITGGTGRFAGASGTFTVKRLVSITVGVASSTFEGYILLPTK